MPPLAVFYSFARSGGTIVNRCLGAIEGNLVLSEVNPHGALVPVEIQARDWLELIGPEEMAVLAGQDYPSKIRHLEQAARARGARLVVRDWPALNFLDGLFFDHFQPSGLLEQDLYLDRAGVGRLSAVVARRAAAVYASIVRTFDHLGSLTVEEFSSSYLAYARAVGGRPVIRFEEFCRHPHRELAKLCGWLGVTYSDSFYERFPAFDRCTGDNRVAAGSRGGRSARIEVLPDEEDSPAWRAASHDAGCRAADEILGYDH